ncbi:DUF1453 domain-containing protein [Phenylobacterium hankyongense]|uniref:DUF1453 domain-containing protein n=1 Tax=Phenylobacterium hankyongense TaxID=1813876 RepID=A0A328B3R3_9CAUL|nr:CcdC protein domain-containing protein [Phenylobacterium hankyongense]RAK61195.1 DUF1453 domain-containing protein [Phenylobacterium hankyongense]
MHGYPGNVGYGAYLFPLVFIALAILRNARVRNLKVERLWIAPLMILAATVLSFSQQQAPGPVMIAADIAALAAGAALGWWRGRFTKITVNRETHALTSQASPVGMLLILGIFAIRMGLRTYAAENASALHVSVTDITDAFLLLAVGLVCAQRLEMALRATRLVNEARASN